MDIIFNCPKCEVELAVDASGAGSEITCPECGAPITIPADTTATSAPTPSAPPPTGSVPTVPAPPQHTPVAPAGGGINAIAASAAAKVEHHFSVPVSNKPVEQLVVKQTKPVEVSAKGSAKRIRVKTIRHSDCIEVGRDRFDEFVSDFVNKVGETNIVSLTAVNYSHVEHGGDRLVTDYGLVIVYKG